MKKFFVINMQNQAKSDISCSNELQEMFKERQLSGQRGIVRPSELRRSLSGRKNLLPPVAEGDHYSEIDETSCGSPPTRSLPAPPPPKPRRSWLTQAESRAPEVSEEPPMLSQVLTTSKKHNKKTLYITLYVIFKSALILSTLLLLAGGIAYLYLSKYKIIF